MGRGPSYSEEEIERGMQAVAMLGTPRRAAEALELDGLKIHRDTLRRWTLSYPQRYANIRAEVAPQLRKIIAAQSEDLALRLGDKLDEAITCFDAAQLPQRDLAGAIRNLSTSKGIELDKAMLLRGMPTAIVEQRSANDLLRKLSQTLGIDTNGTAEEIKDAELVEA